MLTVVFVAEYYLQGKAYCTQSWNVSGQLKPVAKPQADEPALGTDATSFAAPWDVGQPMW